MIRRIPQFLILAILATGCKEIVDTDKPVVTIELPADGDVVTTGSGLRLLASLTDNTGLLQYKIVISGIDSLNGIGADSTLSIILINGIPSKAQAFDLDYLFALDDTTFNGYYQLTLSCIDVEGNEALRDTVLFRIENSIDHEPPVFNVGGVVAGDTLGLFDGISPNGTVSDSQTLIYSTIYIGRTDGSDTITSFKFTNIIDNMVDYNNIGWYFPIDSTWSEGAYHIYYTAWDNYSGVSHTIPFYVKH